MVIKTLKTKVIQLKFKDKIESSHTIQGGKQFGLIYINNPSF